jgi:tRNA(Ile)-lysidine synthase
MTGSAGVRTLPQRVLGAVRSRPLWTPGDRVVIAVSGGVDSVVLLVLLARLQGAHKGRLEVATVDHGLRPESAQEVVRVAALAQSLGLPCHVLSLGLKPGPNLSQRAREARQAALVALGSDRIATGHHLDDQAETVLQHLLRGAGMRGLQGMQPLRGPFCRPLLAEPRAVLEAWARSEGLSWTEDPSNAGSQRGQIRALMPELDRLYGGASRTLARSARLLAREDALLHTLADEAWQSVCRPGGLDRAGLSAQHPAMQLRLLRRLTSEVTARVGAEPLEAIVDGALQHTGCLDLGEGWSLVCSQGLLSVEPPGR